MDPVFLVVGVMVFGVALFGLVKVNQAAEAKLDAAWSDAARKVRGSFVPVGGPWYQRTPRRVEVTLDRIEVMADSYIVSHGKSSTAYTRLTATVPNSLGVVLSVYREHLFASLGKALGGQDVEVGDPPFDDLFVVKSNAEDVARAWLHGEVCAGMRLCPDFRYELEKGTLRAICGGIVDDGDLLARALRVVAKLASRATELEDEWALAASRVGGIVRQSLNFARADLGSFTVNRKGVDLVVAVEREEEVRLVTTVTAYVAVTPDDDAKTKLAEAIGDLPLLSMQFREASSVLTFRGIQRDGVALDRVVDAFAEVLGMRTLGPYR